LGLRSPAVVSTEWDLFLTFYLESVDEEWDGTYVRIMSHASEGEPCAIVTFKGHYSYFVGPPNDEALAGHPLADRGLKSYSYFEVINSSWIRYLERMNSVHHLHSPEAYSSLKHFLFTFHDSVFECVADNFSVEVKTGSIKSALREMVITIED